MGVIDSTVIDGSYFVIKKRAGFFGLEQNDQLVLDYLLDKDSEGEIDLLKLSRQTGYP